MIWYILICLLLIFLLWLLLVPVILYTNTDRKRYVLTLPGIFQAAVVPREGLFFIRGWILFVPFTYNPFKPRKIKRKSKVRTRKKSKWNPGNLQKMKGALGAFRIKRLKADIDTDDYTLNAWLVPVFSAVNSDNIELQVNFTGRQFLLLDLRISLGTVLLHMIKTKF